MADTRYNLTVTKTPTVEEVLANPELQSKLTKYGANLDRYVTNVDPYKGFGSIEGIQSATNLTEQDKKNLIQNAQEALGWQKEGIQNAINYVFGSKVLGSTQQKLLGGEYDLFLPKAQQFAQDWNGYVSGSDMNLSDAQKITPIGSDNQGPSATPVTASEAINPDQSAIKPGEPGYMAPNFIGNPAATANQPENKGTTPVVTENNKGTGNTLDEVQQSAIPALPTDFGAGEGDLATWALNQRQAIYQTYQKYGITPSIDEVNWQLTHNKSIANIDASIRDAVTSGRDTRGNLNGVGGAASVNDRATIIQMYQKYFSRVPSEDEISWQLKQSIPVEQGIKASEEYAKLQEKQVNEDYNVINDIITAGKASADKTVKSSTIKTETAAPTSGATSFGSSSEIPADISSNPDYAKIYNSYVNTPEISTQTDKVLALEKTINEFDNQIASLKNDIKKEVEGEASDSYITALATIRGEDILEQKRIAQIDYNEALGKLNSMTDSAKTMASLAIQSEQTGYSRKLDLVQLNMKIAEQNRQIAQDRVNVALTYGVTKRYYSADGVNVIDSSTGEMVDPSTLPSDTEIQIIEAPANPDNYATVEAADGTYVVNKFNPSEKWKIGDAKANVEITEADGRIVVYDKNSNSVIKDLGAAYHAGPAVTNVSIAQQTRNDIATMSNKLAQTVQANKAHGATLDFITPEQWSAALTEWTSNGNTTQEFVDNFKQYANTTNSSYFGKYQGIAMPTSKEATDMMVAKKLIK